MHKTRKKYSKEFKENAVRLMVESELSPTEIAKDLGIHRSILHRWRKEFLSQGANHQAQGKDKELLRLEKEIAELKLEREILKKSAEHFLKTPKMKYRFIQQYRRCYPVGKMCQVLGVARSGYYRWLNRRSGQ